MGRNDELFELWQALRGGLENQEDFRAALDFSLPPVMRFDAWDEIGASDEARFQRRARESPGSFHVRRRDERDAEIRGFHADEYLRKCRVDVQGQ